MKTAIAILTVLFCICSAPGTERQTVKAVLFPFREAVVSARVDSTLLPYELKIGEAFAPGTTLVRLDDARFQIEFNRVKEQYNFAKANYEDKKQLFEKKFTSDFELKKSEFELKLLESNLADAKLNLSYCSIEAPFSGKITEILTREFETVRAGQPLFRIIDDNQLLAVLNVPLSDKALTTPGSAVQIALTSHNLTAAGTIYEVAPQADHRTETVRIRVLIDNAAGKYTAGMTGELIYGQ